ncbi:MAG TPA: right-handed parallel beta-helix repeat-containing protein [Xanthomonadales bacterium]|nr:right-handed parallel beta-helix repeat-containing protein [Xanthomonadales bacterium]
MNGFSETIFLNTRTIRTATLVAGLMLATQLQALTFVVNYNSDDLSDPFPDDGVCETSLGSGQCTVRAAIESANDTPDGPHTVEIPYLPGDSYPVWSATGLQAFRVMTIRGTGAGRAVIQGGLFLDGGMIQAGEAMTIENLELRPDTTSGTSVSGLLVNSPNTVQASDLTIIPGPGGIGPGIYVTGAGYLTCRRCVIRDGGSVGVRVVNFGNLNLIDSRITNNVNIEGNQGAGIRLDSGNLLIRDSLIDNNYASGFAPLFRGSGGGIYTQPGSNLHVINSTISGNRANTDGGGIYANGSVLLENATITRNTANADDDITPGSGGGIYINDFTVVEARNSIIHGNFLPCPPGVPFCVPDGRNCGDEQGGTIGLASFGWVMVGTDAHCPIMDLTLEPNYTSTNFPNLGPLTQLGGLHPVHPIDSTGLEADGGNPDGCTFELVTSGGTVDFPLIEDQRGAPRPMDSDPNPSDGNSCDIGAYEAKCFGDDPDGDYVGSQCDVCPNDFDPLQEDSNGNGIGDVCEGPSDVFFFSGFDNQ